MKKCGKTMKGKGSAGCKPMMGGKSAGLSSKPGMKGGKGEGKVKKGY